MTTNLLAKFLTFKLAQTREGIVGRIYAFVCGVIKIGISDSGFGFFPTKFVNQIAPFKRYQTSTGSFFHFPDGPEYTVSHIFPTCAGREIW